jgi:hypothetical protein
MRASRTYSFFRGALLPLLLLPLAFLIPATPALASESPCQNEQLRQNARVSNIDPASGQPYDAGLADCRAYEQVSPPEKEGGSGGVYYFDSPFQAYGPPGYGPVPLQSLANGSAIVYPAEPFYHSDRALGGFAELYTSKRAPTEWSTTNDDTLSPEEVPTPILPLAAEEEPHAKIYEETPDGSKVFFTDEKLNLIAGSTAALGEPDLYEYITPTPSKPNGELVDLTVDQTGHADVQGVLGVGGEGNEEGSYVYFVAGGSLVAGTTSGECSTVGSHTVGTGCKLYLRHDGVTTFIITLSPADESEGTLGSSVDDWQQSGRTAEVSPDGRYVAFGSNYELNREATEGLKDFPHGPEIFRYSAESRELTCVSCLPGTPSEPDGSSLPEGAINLVSTHAEINGADRQRYMLNDGRVFFDTPNELVSADVNHQTDIYEYEPEVVGSCMSSTSSSSSELVPSESGCISLVSGGTSEVSTSVLADVSSSGSDVFFTTSQSLVPEDQDEITDVYDAREGGGFPPLPEPACPIEAACPAPTSGPPVVPSAPSLANTALEAPGVSTNTPSVTKPKATKAQLLAAALRTCKKAHAHSKKARTSCEKQAKAKYAPKKPSKPKAKKPTNDGRAK